MFHRKWVKDIGRDQLAMGVAFRHLTTATWKKGRDLGKHFYMILKREKNGQYGLEKKKEVAPTKRHGTEEQGTKRKVTPASPLCQRSQRSAGTVQIS